MLKHAKTEPLKVSLLTISPHNRAILEFFFSGAGRNLFKVVPVEQADAFILDHDYPGAKEDWETHTDTLKPGIMLSVHAVELPNTIWIPKPLTSKALTEAVGRVYELMELAGTASRIVPEKPAIEPQERLPRAPSQPFGIPKQVSRPPLRSLVFNLNDEDEDDEADVPASPATVDSMPVMGIFDPAETDIPIEEIDRPVSDEVSEEDAQRRWKMLCGEQDDIQNPAAAALFTPENYLLIHVQEAVKLVQDSRQMVQLKLSFSDYALFLPDTDLVYCNLDARSDEFAALCHNPVQTGQFALHIPGGAELLQLEQQVNDDAGRLLDLEAFLWVSSLLTARGCLARGVDINRKVALKHWPNMTRLEQFPHIMRIAALWNQRPGTVFDIAKALNVPQRYVFSFYTAANALNLFELDQTKLKSREKEKPKESRGLFSRLLKRLLGGGAK
jgi:hypothetical protein